MIRIVEREQERFAFKQGLSSGVLMGPVLIGSAGVLTAWNVMGWQVPALLLVLGLWILFVFGDITEVVLDRDKNLVRVSRRRFLRGLDDDVLPLDSVTGVFVGRKATAFFANAIYLQAMDDLRVTGFQFARWPLVFFASQVAAFLTVPCVEPGKLDPIGKIASGEKHPLDRLLSGDKSEQADPWEQSEHPLDRLVPHRKPESPKQQEAEEAEPSEPPAPPRGPDGKPVQ